MARRGRPVSNPFARVARTPVTTHVSISDDGASTVQTRNAIRPPEISFETTSAPHPPETTGAPFPTLEPLDVEDYSPSNPNHHQIGQQPNSSGNKRYAAAVMYM